MKRIVVLGGGTGTFTVLKGLKNYPYDITAIVTMFDSGGSSGVLRDEHGVLPPGDIRRCLVALSSGEKEEILRDLFNYRFETGESLKGHSFGNILLTALTEIYSNEADAIAKAGQLLNIQGRVLPVTLEKSQLHALLEDDTVVTGERYIDIPEHDGSLKIQKVFAEPPVKANREALEYISDADVLVLGPGDLYTSVIPNLLPEGMREAIQNSKAKKVYVLNLFTKWGETSGFAASDFASEIRTYSGLESIDYVICNKEEMPYSVLEKYALEKKFPIEIDDDLASHTRNIIRENLCRKDYLLRHESKRIGEVIARIVEEG